MLPDRLPFQMAHVTRDLRNSVAPEALISEVPQHLSVLEVLM